MSKTERIDGIYILHIADSLQDVIDFLAGKDYSDFAPIFIGAKMI